MAAVAGVAESLIQGTDWSKLREATGTASGVGVALLDLLTASTPEATRDPYWRIENHVVVQGEVFEAAEACTGVLVAALVDERPRHVRICILDILFQILGGSPSPTTGTPPDVLERCQAAAREGLWGLVREAACGERDAAWEVLELIVPGDRLAGLRRVLLDAHARSGDAPG